MRLALQKIFLNLLNGLCSQRSQHGPRETDAFFRNPHLLQRPHRNHVAGKKTSRELVHLVHFLLQGHAPQQIL